ncbi:MAG: 4-alpha-glucanotransferase [Dysgonomonas sp.]|uniref:4-alpha-glucanotransferase n=1 Tax=Dysgonomonas sp. TaxID=1891233 RepID=UPI003A8B43DE
MRLKLQIDYHTDWGQTVYVCGSVPALGNWEKDKAAEMKNISPSIWELEIEAGDATDIEYQYLVKDQNNIIAHEWGSPHWLRTETDKRFDVQDVWRGVPQQKFLYTSCFSESFFAHGDNAKVKYYKKTILINVTCVNVKKNQKLILCGASETLGNWKPEDALELTQVRFGSWQVAINAPQIKTTLEYKLAIYDNSTKKIVHWEEGFNRVLSPLPASPAKEDMVKVESIAYAYGWMNWKAAGVSIPVFSLRSNDSFGIGEFSDLRKMVDWAVATGQKIIQVLPINDTTITYTWIDSYPYNAISIYALHPIYLGLKAYPLKDENLYKEYEREAGELNTLENVDYDRVLALKWRYIKDLFTQSGTNTLKSKDYLAFYEQNEEWLFPYACFSYLRDKYETANFRKWKTNSAFDKKKLIKLTETDKDAKKYIELSCFTQYLLHKQLVEVKEYAHQNEVVLKGDIPIGISRDSVEAWVEPHLFNLDVQTGAPPDDFSFFGQNWGFPTYNWEEMAKDGYRWWLKRFRKMADYFDAYRIDHILGFFRIWEIPLSSVQGLLGYFSPALPLTADEIRSYGLWFDEDRMLKHYIHENFLGNIFGSHVPEVIEKYLRPTGWQRFELKEEFDTQAKIKEHFTGRDDEKSNYIRDGLYSLCNEVLFVRDKREPYKFHPRITAQYNYSYRDLDDGAKDAFNRLYNEFFYRRHSQYWRDQAMTKLPTLISSTSMLVCGEDLGMVPESVPSVMNELQILSLEIERMPKEREVLFNDLHHLPYLSVCTTSTHDMSPLRLWWKEDRQLTQQYYNQVLWKHGAAPEECTADLCAQIVSNHLYSPAMLAILPLQDWLSIDDTLKRPVAEDERINIPAISQHYWRYRMHLTLEELLEATDFNRRVKSMVGSSGRE